MATSDIDICSQALDLIGITPISAFDTEGNKGRVCGNLYPGVRGKLLGEYPWRFLFQKKQLGQVTPTPTNEWSYAYQLPSDIEGAPIAVFNSSAVDAPRVKDWQVYGRKIFTNYTTLYIDYRVRTSEPNWPSYFTQLMVYEMAWHLALPLTRDKEKMQIWNEVARGTSPEQGRGGFFRTATQLDAQGHPTEGLQAGDYSLIAARMGGG